MTSMGALNVQLDQKTKDTLEMMTAEMTEAEGPTTHRRRTMENIATIAINNQIQLILPPDGTGAPIGGGQARGRGRGRGGRRGRPGRPARARHVGNLLHNGRVQCASCQRTYVQARLQG